MSRLPAYGRELVAAQRIGRNVPWLCLSLGWNLGRGFPRLVIPDGMAAAEIDLHPVAGLDCMVAHRGETHRAFDVAEAAMLAGATRCPVLDMTTGRMTATDEIRAARGMGVANAL